MSFRIFISSVQKEFEAERSSLAEFIKGDPLLSKQFETFVFEHDVPARDQRPNHAYLDELSKCDLYLGLFGDEYGWENKEGLSPTHLEFKRATELGIPRLIHIKGANDQNQHPKMQALIRAAGNELIRRRFDAYDSLRANVYASLVNHLETTGILHNLPWDATPARNANLENLDSEAIARFIRSARKWRNSPLPEDASPTEVLAKLHLLEAKTPTQGAVLLFGREPQSFLPASLVKCAHFHGTHVAKPIPAHLDIHGTAFDLVNGAIDFVLSKISASVGTREASSEAPVEYEIPQEVIREAIVNAIAHRDYTSNASVQVSIFADRVEIWNPGNLPPSLTLELLRKEHRSFPRNLLFAEALYLARYIERYGTGTGDMIRLCREAGLPEPDFQLTDGFLTILRRPTRADDKTQSKSSRQRLESGLESGLESIAGRILAAVEDAPLPKAGLANALGHKSISSKLNLRVNQLLEAGLIERTLPDKPTSRLQKYRLTTKGRELLSSLESE
jgi:predicted HTH transcriptional regulator